MDKNVKYIEKKKVEEDIQKGIKKIWGGGIGKVEGKKGVKKKKGKWNIEMMMR